MYAVIKTGGKQYRVAEGDVLNVEIVFKYKAKSNYRKRQGHRQPFTKVEISKIEA